MRQLGSRVMGVLGLALACVACGDDACDELAARLRACCARGPEELRDGCEAEARRLEDDGNADACEAFDTTELDGCGP